ncbi:RPII140-upstream gene protein-like [Glossina fuscipes]|uniref:Complex I assembly factor TIMMDC1, mitochondrial n=1 Tax=Glossina fuscipes TaxID=7396 RepID=A0A9C5ZGD1_9MUSC|nr:RPII140-upstream gene protein-like [Glossina fuscipes]
MRSVGGQITTIFNSSSCSHNFVSLNICENSSTFATFRRNAKGGFKWGWQVALFATSYCGIVTMISVYRRKSSLYEYLPAGLISGALYKVNMGLKGIIRRNLALALKRRIS